MKLQGIYRGNITIVDLPICNYQWSQFKRGEPAERCFPQLNNDELEFIITSTPVASEYMEPSEINTRHMVVDYRGLHVDRF
ncbi:MAG: hypothetical protein ACM3VS_18510 [Candidatus Dadabacteria bacterium]